MSSSLLVGVLLNRWSCRLLLSVYYWTECRSRDRLPVCERMQPSQTWLYTDQVVTWTSVELRRDS